METERSGWHWRLVTALAWQVPNPRLTEGSPGESRPNASRDSPVRGPPWAWQPQPLLCPAVPQLQGGWAGRALPMASSSVPRLLLTGLARASCSQVPGLEPTGRTWQG